MAFSKSSSELPESQIEYHDNSGARRWVVLLIYVVLALVAATLVVFAGRWVYHRVSNNSGPSPTTLSPLKTSPAPSSNAPSPAPNGAKSGTPTQNQSSSSSSGSSSAGNKTPSNTAKPAPQPSTLPNNGPGQAMALFVVTTFVAATLHFTAALRRAAKSV